MNILRISIIIRENCHYKYFMNIYVHRIKSLLSPAFSKKKVYIEMGSVRPSFHLSVFWAQGLTNDRQEQQRTNNFISLTYKETIVSTQGNKSQNNKKYPIKLKHRNVRLSVRHTSCPFVYSTIYLRITWHKCSPRNLTYI